MKAMKGTQPMPPRKDGRQRWRGLICVNNKNRHLGVFETQEEAHQAFLEADKKLRDGWSQATPIERVQKDAHL